MPSSKWEARLAQRIAHRWLYWEPWCLRAIREVPCITPRSVLMEYCGFHLARIQVCLRQGLPWTTITKYKLDDPFTAEKDFQFQVNAAVERRRQKKERHAHSSRTSL